MNLAFMLTFVMLLTSITGCSENKSKPQNASSASLTISEQRLSIYKAVNLTADLQHLSDNQKTMLCLLIDAANIVDEVFWLQAYGENKSTLLSTLIKANAKTFAQINYGPWDRLNNDNSFISHIKNKPLGANFYPSDMRKNEFEQADFEDKKGLYSLVRRDKHNKLFSIAYSEAYAEQINRMAAILLKAAKYADDEQFAYYLTLRANALLIDDYSASDIAWLSMKNNQIDLIIGPIETDEDKLFSYRTAYMAYILIKDPVWSQKLAKYVDYLPQLQKNLPVPEQYKKEGSSDNLRLSSQLNVYDAVYFSGHANAGSKPIAINLPNDESIQLNNGTRRVQLKNTIRAKFEHIMQPLAEVLITPEQRKNITFNAFFTNAMFHEIAHGLGIKNTVENSLKNKGTVREALKEHASAMEEGKADIVALYMIKQLLDKKMITQGSLDEYYTTFLVSIFQAVRFGAKTAQGKANVIHFNYLKNEGAFSRNEKGLYQIDMTKMIAAIKKLSNQLLILQGNGNYQKVDTFINENNIIHPILAQDLLKLENMNIPVDIVFNQGKQVLVL